MDTNKKLTLKSFDDLQVKDFPHECEIKPNAYISLPMTGIENLNRTLEEEIYIKLRGMGYWVYSPSRLAKFVEKTVTMPEYKHYLGFDIWNMSKVDVVFLAKGWEFSQGCLEEIGFCIKYKIPIVDLETMLPFDTAKYYRIVNHREIYLKYLFCALGCFAGLLIACLLVVFLKIHG